jgi:hypothetical protein
MTPTRSDREITALDWAGVLLLAVCGVLASVLETLLVPLYLGSTVFPIAVVLAVATNVLLPWLAGELVPKTIAILAPLAGWLIGVLGFGSVARPEGDVILPGAPNSLAFVTYGVVIGGFLAGVVTVIWLTTPRHYS